MSILVDSQSETPPGRDGRVIPGRPLFFGDWVLAGRNIGVSKKQLTLAIRRGGEAAGWKTRAQVFARLVKSGRLPAFLRTQTWSFRKCRRLIRVWLIVLYSSPCLTEYCFNLRYSVVFPIPNIRAAASLSPAVSRRVLRMARRSSSSSGRISFRSGTRSLVG